MISESRVNSTYCIFLIGILGEKNTTTTNKKRKEKYFNTLIKTDKTAIIFYKYWQKFLFDLAVKLFAIKLQACGKMMFKYYGIILTENRAVLHNFVSFDKIFMMCFSYNKPTTQTSRKSGTVVLSFFFFYS